MRIPRPRTRWGALAVVGVVLAGAVALVVWHSPDTSLLTQMLLGMVGRACANLGRYEEATRVIAAGSGSPSDVSFFGVTT